jgi:propionyl-CoA synthetase
MKKYDLSKFETLFLAGERLDPDTYHWATALLNKPVIDHWWQTETGWAITANFKGLGMFPTKAGSASKPSPGYDIRIMGADGKELPRGKEGVIVVKLPLPPGTFMNLWHNEARFRKSYMDPFPGTYFTGDGGFIDEDGYVWVMGRVDDVINVAGHRLSTGAMEEIIAMHPDVAECAVVGAYDQMKGEVPIGFIVLKAGVTKEQKKIVEEVVQSIRDKIGPVACFKMAAVVKRLPKTRSGKILRGTIRKIADGQEYNTPSTIDDPETLGEIEGSVKTIGYGHKAETK